MKQCIINEIKKKLISEIPITPSNNWNYTTYFSICLYFFENL